MHAGTRYKLVVFDFDGTLADSFPWFLRTINQVAAKYRFKPIAAQEIDKLRGCNGRQLMAHLGLPLWKVPLITSEMRRLMAQSIAQIPLFDGVDRLLANLPRRGVDAAVVTSNSYENVQTILGTGNASQVRYFECGTSIFGKRAKFRKLLIETGIPPAQVLCIGDEIRDAQAATGLGLNFIGVSWGYTKPDALAQYSARTPFGSLDEILHVL